MSKASEAQAFNFGMLMGALDAARKALGVAHGARGLLPVDDAEMLHKAYDVLLGIEQRAWLARSKP